MYSLLRRSYAYSTLSIETLKKFLTYMRDRYPRLLFYTENDGIVKRAKDFKPLFEFYFENLSMIPDEKQYVVIAEGDRAIGVLDEAFVSEYGQIGVKFVEAGRCWRILELYGNKVYVAPEEDPTGAVPSWVGDEIPGPAPRCAGGRGDQEGVRGGAGERGAGGAGGHRLLARALPR